MCWNNKGRNVSGSTRLWGRKKKLLSNWTSKGLTCVEHCSTKRKKMLIKDDILRCEYLTIGVKTLGTFMI